MQNERSDAQRDSPLQQRLQVVMDSGAVAMLEVDLRCGKVLWSVHGDLLLALHPGWQPRTLTEVLDFVHPEDRARVQHELDNALATTVRSRQDRFRVVRKDGAIRHVNVYVNFDYGEGGKPERMVGMLMDITETVAHQQELEASERLKVLALTAADMGIFIQDLRHGTLRWTDRQFEMFGISPENFDGKVETAIARIHPDDQAATAQEIQRVVESRSPKFLAEFRIPLGDDRNRWIAAVGEVLYSDRGEPMQIIGVNFDITERKLHEQALRESESFRRLAMNAAKMGAWQWEVGTGRLRWSEEQEALFGFPPSTFDQNMETFWSRIHPDDLPKVKQYASDIIRRRGRRYETEFRILLEDGRERWIGALGEVEYDKELRAQRIFGVNFDTTDRVRAAQSVAESERLRRIALSAARMGAWELNPITGEALWSAEQFKLFGAEPGKFYPTLESIRSAVHPDDRERVDRKARHAVETKSDRYYDEFRVVHPDGNVRWLASVGEYLYENGAAIRAFGVTWDITERKDAEDRLQQLNQELQLKVADFEALLRAIPAAVSIGLDPESADIRVNAVFANMLGVQDQNQNVSISSAGVDKLPFRVLKNGKDIPPEELPQQVASRTKTEVRDQELEFVVQDGRRYDLFGHAVPILDDAGDVRGSVAVFMDITGRKQAEQALRTSEKLAAAGRMAASLAHEINNPLAAVTNLLYLIGQDPALSSNSRHFLSMASAEISRVSHITRNMLAFYRDTSAPVEVDLGELTDGVLELYEPKIRNSGIETKVLRDGNCRLVAFPGEMRQVISNLVVNAVEAMPGGGRLEIRVHRTANHNNGRPGVRLVIADTGPGIPAECRSRLFEPFFTTKGEKGTGLGLWVSRDIISKHDGNVRVRTSSMEGRSGTCFSVFFPADGAAVRPQNRAESNKASSNS